MCSQTPFTSCEIPPDAPGMSCLTSMPIFNVTAVRYLLVFELVELRGKPSGPAL